MNYFAVRCAIAALVFLFTSSAQTNQAQEVPASSACPTAKTLDELVKALDDAVSGLGNKDRSCLRDVLLPQARLSPMMKAADGSFEPHLLTVDDWINAVAKRGSTAFYEVQIKVKSETYGHVAHLWSTYEIRPTPDGKPQVTGINSIQAVFDGTRWRVLSVLWEAETSAGPVPERYRP